LTHSLRTAALGAAVALALGCGDDGSNRRAQAADRGAEVMPFDLDATTHHFEPVDDGLVETVVADEPIDDEQVGLIQEHLQEEAGRFSRGDYGDPAAIHGDDMPGLADLEAGADAITIDYEAVDDGATVTFTTDDPQLVDALHRWAAAQTADHGDHAE
jgi:hypothetical protein